MTDLVDPSQEERYNATITEIRKIHPELWIFRVKPDEGLQFFHPGQYTTLALSDWEATNDPTNNEDAGENLRGRLIKRAYSISYPVFKPGTDELVAPDELDFYEFYITLVQRRGEPGQEPSLTPRLFALDEGARIWVGPKITGRYTLEGVTSTDQVILAATGTGEAPHNAMVTHLLRNGHQADIVSIICVRYGQDLGYQDIHHRLCERYANYHYITLTTRETRNLDRKVYIQDLVSSGELEEQTGIRLDPSRTHVYLCGNPAMIGLPKYTGTARTYPTPVGMVEILESRGLRADYKKVRGNIHFEEYW